MSAENGVDWAAVLADIEARISKLQTVADGIREMLAGTASVPGPSGSPGGGLRPDSFLKMSIPEATKKLLETTRAKQSTQEVMDALVKGGLPESKYGTVYSILSRREKQVGDIINMKGDWALAEWYPNHRPKAKKDALLRVTLRALLFAVAGRRRLSRRLSLWPSARARPRWRSWSARQGEFSHYAPWQTSDRLCGRARRRPDSSGDGTRSGSRSALALRAARPRIVRSRVGVRGRRIARDRHRAFSSAWACL